MTLVRRFADFRKPHVSEILLRGRRSCIIHTIAATTIGDYRIHGHIHRDVSYMINSSERYCLANVGFQVEGAWLQNERMTTRLYINCQIRWQLLRLSLSHSLKSARMDRSLRKRNNFSLIEVTSLKYLFHFDIVPF